jgi:predicted Zn finger-like uncharacterized protein
MVKHFDPSCPKCKQKFHVHHEDLRYAGIKLLCPYCQNEFFVDECETLVEHDGTVTHPQAEGAGALTAFQRPPRHGRACPGHLRLAWCLAEARRGCPAQGRA